MPYRCQICKDCSDTEGFYQSERDCPSELSDSDAEYVRKWGGRSYRRIYRNHRGSGRTGSRSRPEREESRGNWENKGNSNYGRIYRRHNDRRNEGRNTGNGSERENYRRDNKREQDSDHGKDIDVRNIFHQGSEVGEQRGRAGKLSNNNNSSKLSTNDNQSNRGRNSDSDSDQEKLERNERNNNTLITEKNFKERYSSESSSCDSSSDSSVKESNQKEDKKNKNGNVAENIEKNNESHIRDNKTEDLAKEPGVGYREEKQKTQSDSKYTTDSDSFWECSSASGSETDTCSESEETHELNDMKSSDRAKRSVAGSHPKKHQEKSRTKRFTKNVSFLKMPSGKKYPIITPKPTEFTCGTETNKIELHPNGRISKREYKIVEEEMQNSIVYHANCENGGGCFKKYEIVKIEKLINGCLWKRYRHMQHDIITEHGYANQRMLFHGSKDIDAIVNTGFDERYSNFNGMFGAGLYFAKHSSKANQYVYGYMGGNGCPLHSDKDCHTCERKLLLCRVTLGRSKNHYTGQQLAHPPPEYNSVVGVPSNQKGGLKYHEYIVYRGEQIYPEYLITYKIQD